MPHTRVIDYAGCAQMRRRPCELIDLGVVAHRELGFDVDVQRIEKQPAGRRIRARVLRTIGEKGVKRIERNRRSTRFTHRRTDPCEGAEVAYAPIGIRAQRVKMFCGTPNALARSERWGQVTRIWHER